MSCYFFCGIGGSGMLPLAVLLYKSGHVVIGSDRSYDKGENSEKFQSIKNLGIKLFPQDASGVSNNIDMLVVSSAIENSIPDVKSAIDKNIKIIKRGQLLAQLFNSANNRLAIAGTSGKSTVTGMVGTMLTEMELNPTIVNGGDIRNFKSSEFPSIRKGDDNLFVAEMDESDGSIAYYNPSIGILNNIALDHKTMAELEELFGDYLARSSSSVIVNYDQPRVKKLCTNRAKAKVISYAINDKDADVIASGLVPMIDGISFDTNFKGNIYKVSLNVTGRHNVENALAAISVCVAMEIDIEQGISALQKFKGIHRRMEYIGTNDKGIAVYDDFAHNPDKISASLQSLKNFDGRLIIMFQPHGFAPLRLMGSQMVEVFAKYLDKDDILIMPEVYYAGGTVDRSVTAKHIIYDLKANGVNSYWFSERAEVPVFVQNKSQKGDRIVIMGARDDTLHGFAHKILAL